MAILRAAPRRVPFLRSTVTEFAATDARRDALIRETKLQLTNRSDKQNRPRPGAGQITYPVPGGSKYKSEEAQQQLLDVIVKARAARGNRKMLRKPRHPRKVTDSPMFKRMKFHLRRLARRALNDLAKAGRPIPDAEELATVLAAFVWQTYPNLIYTHEAGGQSLGRSAPRYLNGDGAVQRVAMSAASYTLEHWTPDYIEERVRRGRAGGLAGRPRMATKVTSDNAIALAALPAGLTRAQQAQALGISESTVKRIFRSQLAGPLRNGIRSLDS